MNIFLKEINTRTKELYHYLKNNKYVMAIGGPFKVCFKHKADFFLWFTFVIVAGQLGTIINVIRRCLFENWAFGPALCPDSSSGNFYTFALVLIASLLGPLFVRFLKRNKPEYRTIKIIFVTILIFTLLLCATFFSFATQDSIIEDLSSLTNDDVSLDIKQFVFYLLSIIFAWYSFGWDLIIDYKHDNYYNLDDDYLTEENQRRNDLVNEIQNPNLTEFNNLDL